MKTLSEQIIVMQHAETGGAIAVNKKDGSLSHIIVDSLTLIFDWQESDYEVHSIPDKVFGKRKANGTMTTFPDQAALDSDGSASVAFGAYYLLGKTETDLLINAGLLPVEE